MKISIITPFYKHFEFIQELADILEPQLTDEIEWLICCDGTNDHRLDSLKAKIFYLEQNSGGASKPRNICLDSAIGEYVVFIDSDDIVSTTYVQDLLSVINLMHFDYCLFSWEYLHSKEKIIITDNPPSWNCSLWNCLYKRTLIGQNRFNESLITAEDYDFNITI